MRCRAIKPPLTDACGEPASWRVTFYKDEEHGPHAMCDECKIFYDMKGQAESAPIRAERI